MIWLLCQELKKKFFNNPNHLEIMSLCWIFLFSKIRKISITQDDPQQDLFQTSQFIFGKLVFNISQRYKILEFHHCSEKYARWRYIYKIGRMSLLICKQQYNSCNASHLLMHQMYTRCGAQGAILSNGAECRNSRRIMNCGKRDGDEAMIWTP